MDQQNPSPQNRTQNSGADSSLGPQATKYTGNKMRPETEFSGPFYKHPYFIYIAITVGLFLFLVVMGIVAMNSSSLIPQNS